MTAERRRIVLTTALHREVEAVQQALRQLGVLDERQLTLYATPGGGGWDGDPAQVVAGACGLVLAGGGDVAPTYYGEEVRSDARVHVQRERDEMEWALLEHARSARLPVWGICRGQQLLNVFLGGTLWQDLPSQRAGSMCHHVAEPRDALVHRLWVTDAGRGTALGEILGRETAYVNSRHHQALRRVAEGFVVVARAADGVAEANVLTDDDWWVEAVEWHPENLMALAQQRALARRFLEAADRYEKETSR